MNVRPDWAFEMKNAIQCEQKLIESPELKDQILSECFLNLEVRFQVDRRNYRPGQCIIPQFEEGAEIAAWLAAKNSVYREKVLKEIIPLMPLDVAEKALAKIKHALTPVEQNAYVVHLLKNKGIEHLNILKKLDFSFGENEEKEFLRLNALLAKPKVAQSTLINAKHGNLYGNQDEYKEFYDRTVKLIVDEIKDGLKTPVQAESLISIVADRRKNFAHQSDTPDKFMFGLARVSSAISVLNDFGVRKEIWGEASTFLASDQYSKYYERIIDKIPLQIMMDDKILTYINGRGEITHYVPDEELVKILQNEYMNLSNAKFTDPQEAAKAIGNYHWLASHLMRWHRGSAAIMEQMTDAIWIKNFGKPPTKIPGLSLDCEALIQPNREAYAAQYAGFFSALPAPKMTIDTYTEVKKESKVTPHDKLSQLIDRVHESLNNPRELSSALNALENEIHELKRLHGDGINLIVGDLLSDELYLIRNTQGNEEKGYRKLINLLWENGAHTPEAKAIARATDIQMSTLGKKDWEKLVLLFPSEPSQSSTSIFAQLNIAPGTPSLNHDNISGVAPPTASIIQQEVKKRDATPDAKKQRSEGISAETHLISKPSRSR